MKGLMEDQNWDASRVAISDSLRSQFANVVGDLVNDLGHAPVSRRRRLAINCRPEFVEERHELRDRGLLLHVVQELVRRGMLVLVLLLLFAPRAVRSGTVQIVDHNH